MCAVQRETEAKELELKAREDKAKAMVQKSQSKWDELLEKVCAHVPRRVLQPVSQAVVAMQEDVLSRKTIQLMSQKKHLDLVSKRINKLKRTLESPKAL